MRYTTETLKALKRADRALLKALAMVQEERAAAYESCIGLTSSQLTKQVLVSKLAGEANECFSIMYLDNQHKLIKFEILFNGTIDASAVYPRVVLEKCIANSASAVILAHNHPSGVLEASQADKQITSRIKEVLSMVDIRVLDHIIIGGTSTFSFAEQGLL